MVNFDNGIELQDERLLKQFQKRHFSDKGLIKMIFEGKKQDSNSIPSNIITSNEIVSNQIPPSDVPISTKQSNQLAPNELPINKGNQNEINHLSNKTKVDRTTYYIQDFNMLLKIIDSTKVKDFTNRHKEFVNNFMDLEAEASNFVKVKTEILSSNFYEEIRLKDGFKNICSQMEKLDDIRINIAKTVAQIEQDKLKIVCDISYNESTKGYVNESDAKMEEVRMKIFECKMEYKKYNMYLSLQKGLHELISNLKSPLKIENNTQEFSIFKNIVQYMYPNTSTYDLDNDTIKSHETLPIKNLTIDPKYCEIDLKTLQKLDQLVGIIIDSTKYLKEENIYKAKKLIESISIVSEKNDEIKIPVYKAQRLIYILNGLFIGKYDQVLNTAYDAKQKFEDKKNKAILDEVISEMRNPNIVEKLNTYFSKQNKDEIIDKKFKDKMIELGSYDDYYARYFFDKNATIILESMNNGISKNRDISIGFTNVNGVLNNVYVQNGLSLTQGGVYYSFRNTIGPAFYMNLMGSNIEADINAMSTVQVGKKVFYGE